MKQNVKLRASLYMKIHRVIYTFNALKYFNMCDTIILYMGRPGKMWFMAYENRKSLGEPVHPHRTIPV